MRFEIEETVRGPETPDLKSNLDEELVIKEIDALIARPESFLGEGKTAEVRIMSGNENCCMKIVDDIRLNKLYDTDRPRYNSEKVEFDLLQQAHAISGKVKVPRPYLAWKIHTDTDRQIGVLVMERLPAFSLKQIHEGARLPKGFNIQTFFSDLREYLERLHSELNIHHRDIAEGNILVDKNTGAPYLIDFGDSAAAWPGENVYKSKDTFGRTLHNYPEDNRALNDVQKRLSFLPQLTK
ncbi:MAG: RIO1 family regulatory kinase/ATPase [Patescibacteria group bacterium]